MRVKRNRQSESYIAQMSKVLNIKDEICRCFTADCGECPLCKLGVFDTDTCLEIDKLAKRLELAYKVVETL